MKRQSQRSIPHDPPRMCSGHPLRQVLRKVTYAMSQRLFIFAMLAMFAVLTSAAIPLLDSLQNPALADDDDDDDNDDDDDRPRPRVELIISGLSDAEAAALQRRGFRVMQSALSGLLEEPVRRVLGPPGSTTNAALREIRRVAPSAVADRNSRYVRSTVGGYLPQGASCGDSCPHFVLTGWTSKYSGCQLPAPIGVIDTGIDESHPALSGAQIESATVRRSGRRPSGTGHGTAIVSLLVGQPRSSVAGLLPRARILAVDPFHRSGNEDVTDAFDLVAALDLLAARGVEVINMSLSGPPNSVLERGVQRLVRRGATIVAAAGSSSSASMGYPARYPGLIAVAAVDSTMKPSRLSARGAHIAYVGPGVGIPVAVPGGNSRLAAGTSFAAPFVAAAVAVARSQSDRDGKVAAIEGLQVSARDLGAQGRDPIFGWGLIQLPELSAC